MKRDLSAKSVAGFFLAVTLAYLATFYGWEAWQHRHGPWQAEFRSDTNGVPTLVLRQPGLGIQEFTFRFSGEHASLPAPASVVFAKPGSTLPFGRILYEDLRSHPGVVTLDLFGHELEWMPRALVVNGKEIPWAASSTVTLSPADKPAVPPHPPKPAERGGNKKGAGTNPPAQRN